MAIPMAAMVVKVDRANVAHLHKGRWPKGIRSFGDVAADHGCSPEYVTRLLKKFEENGCLAPRKVGTGLHPTNRKFTAERLKILEDVFAENFYDLTWEQGAKAFTAKVREIANATSAPRGERGGARPRLTQATMVKSRRVLNYHGITDLRL